MLPHEIRELDRRKELLLVEAAPPVKADKIRYYRDRMFMRLLRPAVERPRLIASLVQPPIMPGVTPAMSDAEIDGVLAGVTSDPR
jgi:type IV secretory pathway TraG/TraD family ATPase VirD4